MKPKRELTREDWLALWLLMQAARSVCENGVPVEAK